MAFNLADALNLTDKTAVSNLDTGIKMLELALIEPHPENFFPVESDITDLAESIELNGLCQPLIVTPTEDGRYRTIAGHRRRSALLQLAEKDPEKWKYVACNIKHPASHELEMLMLIQTNTEAREIGWSEKTKAATMVEEILVKLQKEQGVQLPGKMRTHVAKLIKTSESQIARAKYISGHLIEKAKQMHDLSDSAAYQLAHLQPYEQAAICDHYKEGWEITPKQISKYVDGKKNGTELFDMTWEERKNLKICYQQTGNPLCEVAEHTKAHCHNQCCRWCNHRLDCHDACSVAVEDAEQVKTSLLYHIGQRVRKIWREKNIDPDLVCDALNYENDDEGIALLRIENGLENISDLDEFVELCKVLDTSADYLLGLEKPADASSTQISDGWRKLYYDGKPEERQLCEVLITDNVDPGTGKKVCEVWPARWIGGKFVSALNNRTETRRTKLLWRPLPAPPEGYSFCMHAEDKSDA